MKKLSNVEVESLCKSILAKNAKNEVKYDGVCGKIFSYCHRLNEEIYPLLTQTNDVAKVLSKCDICVYAPNSCIYGDAFEVDGVTYSIKMEFNYGNCIIVRIEKEGGKGISSPFLLLNYDYKAYGNNHLEICSRTFYTNRLGNEKETYFNVTEWKLKNWAINAKFDGKQYETFVTLLGKAVDFIFANFGKLYTDYFEYAKTFAK